MIGPRGIGKTHLVALLHHRVRRDAELDDRLRIAWLPGDPYIAGYHNLLLLILQTLQQTCSAGKPCAGGCARPGRCQPGRTSAGAMLVGR
ncbi:MAG: hypothetical protein R3F40_18210 [Candidatus Competibacteraceae bacterium]